MGFFVVDECGVWIVLVWCVLCIENELVWVCYVLCEMGVILWFLI